MAIKMQPPKIGAVLENLSPNFFPIIHPPKQITNVTLAIISDAISAINASYSAIVNPTESASMEVAIPWIIKVVNPILVRTGISHASKVSELLHSSFSFLSWIPSINIFPPMYDNKINAIHGMNFWNAEKICAIVWTHSQPAIGMAAWKNANVPAIMHILFAFILGSCRQFAMETENASIANPIPSKKLFMKKIKLFN